MEGQDDPPRGVYDIQDSIVYDENSLAHPGFKVKYRSNSTSSTKTDYAELPTIKVLGTGGTIASKSMDLQQTAGYDVVLTIEDLLNSIPDLSTTCNLQYEQVFNIDSKNCTVEHLMELKNKVLDDLENFDGIVITHGTDTLEETSFFLQTTIETEKPIVLCGSMRPSTDISSDGPMNLYQAIVIASEKSSRGRGVLVALNDTIGSGLYITKSNANSLDTFKSTGQGYVGSFVKSEVYYYFPPIKASPGITFSLDRSLTSLPEVLIFYAHQDMNLKLVEVAISHVQPKGVVFATMGTGSMSDEMNQLVYELSDKFNIPVIYSKRSMDGIVPKKGLPFIRSKDGQHIRNPLAIAGGYLNPQKSRIFLQLCLAANMSLGDINRAFSKVHGGQV